jgi:hypothetical protein
LLSSAAPSRDRIGQYSHSRVCRHPREKSSLPRHRSTPLSAKAANLDGLALLWTSFVRWVRQVFGRPRAGDVSGLVAQASGTGTSKPFKVTDTKQ